MVRPSLPLASNPACSRDTETLAEELASEGMAFPGDERSCSEDFVRASMAADCVLGCTLACVGGKLGAPAGSWALALAAGSKLTEGR
jgi:hypothetical protein